MIPSPAPFASPAPDSGSSLLLVIATLAHELWCQCMTRQGWRGAATCDESLRTHDALVPFMNLSAVDRKNLLLLVSENIQQLLDDIEFPRGPEREFGADEMREGLRVGWARRVTTDDPHRDLDSEVGTVVDWEACPHPDQQLLRLIRVRWSDGLTREHLPMERDLRRLS